MARRSRKLCREVAEVADAGYACLVCTVHAWWLWVLWGVSKALHTTVMSCYIWNWSLVNISVGWIEKLDIRKCW